MSDSGKDDSQKSGAGATEPEKTPTHEVGELEGQTAVEQRISVEAEAVPAADLPLTSDVIVGAAGTSPIAESTSVESLKFFVRDAIPHAPVEPSKESAKKLTKKRSPKRQEESSEGEPSRRPVLISVKEENIDPKKIATQRVSFSEIARIASKGEVTAHLSDPQTRLYYLYANQVHTDISFRVVDGFVTKNFEAHKFYISVCSPMFDGIVKHCHENNITQMIFFDMEPLQFRNLLHFLYTDKMHCFDEKEVLDTHDIANAFRVDSLKVRCAEELLVMPFVPTNVLFVLQRAMDLEMRDVQLKCIKFVELYQTVIDLLTNEKYFSKEVLKKILICPKLHIPSEIGLLKFIMEWCEDPNVEQESLRDKLHDVVPYLRYDGFALSEFLEFPDLEKVFTVQQIIDVALYMADLKRELPSWCSTEYAKHSLEVVRVLSTQAPPVPSRSTSSQAPPVPSRSTSSQAPPVPSRSTSSQAPPVPPRAASAEATPGLPQAASAEATPGLPQAGSSKKSKDSKSRLKTSKAATKKTVRYALEGTSYKEEKDPVPEKSKLPSVKDRGGKSSAQKVQAEAEELAAEASGLEKQFLRADPRLPRTEVTAESGKRIAKALHLASKVKLRKRRSGDAPDDAPGDAPDDAPGDAPDDALQELHVAPVSRDVFLDAKKDGSLDLEDTSPDIEEDTTAAEDVFQPHSDPDYLALMKIRSAELCFPHSEGTRKYNIRKTEGMFHVMCDKEMLILGATLHFKLEKESKIYVTAIGSIFTGEANVFTKTFSFIGILNIDMPVLLSFPEPFQLPTDFTFKLKVIIEFGVARLVTMPDYHTHGSEISTTGAAWSFYTEGTPIFAGINYTNEFIWAM